MTPDGWQIPEYRELSLKPKKHRYCVCVFVLNEAGRIEKQLAKMAAFQERIDIVIADGGSTDGGVEPTRLEEYGVSALLTKTDSGKLGAQMRMALSYALLRGYEGVVCMDGNDKDDPAALDDFCAALDQGIDHVQGSRFIDGGVSINMPASRFLAVRFLHAPLISLSAAFRYTDTTNGFRAYSRRLLLDERVSPFRKIFDKYELHYYLAIRAARLGFRVREIPVTRAYPAKGPTPTKISPLKGNALVFWTLIRACLGSYNPQDGDGLKP